MNITWVAPDTLTPYPGNAKQHPPEQVQHIANSIKRFGWQQPIVVDRNNVVVIGHGRLFAAKQLLLEQVPVVVADTLSDDEINALRLADNKTNESAWDFSKLEEELAALDIAGIDMEQFGFAALEDDFADAKKEITEDETPAIPKEAKAKRGEIYKLGEHRLMCGDSCDDADISALMGGEKGRMLFTSPPYSDMREYEGNKDLSVDNLAQFIAKYRPYTDYQCVNLGIQRKDNDIVQYWDEYIRIARESGYKMLAWNVWDKMDCGSIGQHTAFVPICHEWIFIFGTEYTDINRTWRKKDENIQQHITQCTQRQKDGSTTRRTHGDMSCEYKKMESVLSLLPEKHNEVRQLHPATFPVGLPAEYIKAMTNENDIVIEPFGGSGTTLIACEQLGRKCRIMELEPIYVDVIIQRWENMTGQKAELIQGVD
ncbi:MAG: ParB N-terminal domain-containing protein [Bacteroidales bacterium]|nr:ParB N-terminal domain-containing protein [Bacteroidales bacterium]